MGLVEQIRSAQRALGWSNQQLLERSGLTFNLTGLSRRLRGEIRTSTEECEALAGALRLGLPKFRLVWPNKQVAA